MNKSLVLMLGHKSMSGKDHFFSLSKSEFGFQRLAFADRLKSVVADLYNFSHDQMHGNLKDVMDERYPNYKDPKTLIEWEEDDYGPMVGLEGYSKEVPNPDYKPLLTPRRILQIFGQDQRSLFADIWASYVFNVEIPRLQALGHNKFIVTDFRFKNEASVALKWANKHSDSFDLKFVKINRPSVTAKTAAGDISENDLNDFQSWHHIIENDSTLEVYESRVIEFLKTLS